MITFKQFLLKLEADGNPLPPPPGGDPLGGGGMPDANPMGGGGMPDPMLGGGGGNPMGQEQNKNRKAVNITNVWDVLKDAIGNYKEEKPKKQINKEKPKKFKSLIK